MIRSTLLRALIHITGWILFLGLIIGFIVTMPAGPFSMWSPWFLLFSLAYLFVFYFNSNVLIPYLYLKKKNTLYFTAVALLFIGIYFLRPFDNIMAHTHRPPQGSPNQGPPDGERHGPLIDIVSIVLFLVVLLFGMAIEILKQWRLTQKHMAMAEADKANAELSFLKSQINPHFLFNTLNNIYSLASTKNDKAPEAVMMLSNIMRYMTDEVSRDFVPLQWELDCAANYIELQKLRLTDKVQVNFHVAGNPADKRIAPLLLMTFIENVFKYGISSREKCNINMRLFIEDDKITFYSQNKIFQIIGHPRTGIGITNTKKRLQHLYPGKHQLQISTENGLFNVELVIHL